MYELLLTWLKAVGISEAMYGLMLKSTGQTLVMTLISAINGFIIGLPLGILLYITRPGQILQNHQFDKSNLTALSYYKRIYLYVIGYSLLNHRFISALVNIFRSIPFIILIVWMIPFTRMIVGTSIGLEAAIIPLSIGVSPLMARMVENSLLEIPSGLIEAARSMGATTLQIIYKVLIPESLPGIVNGITITLITLVGYSAMAGAVGAGGLGQLAIQYGYTTNNPVVMNTVLILLIIMVFIIQFIGDRIVRAVTHK